MGADEKQGPRWIDVLWPISLAPGELARYNWISGLIQLNVTFEEWSSLLGQSEVKPIHRAYTHETTHFFQSIVGGFVFAWCRGLYECAIEALRGATGGKPIKDLTEFAAVIDNLGVLVDDVRLEVFRSQLDEFSRSSERTGLQFKDLIESHAFVVEQLYHARVAATGGRIGASEIAEMALPSAPSCEYRVAFDYAVKELGRGPAFNSFGWLIVISLGALDPVDAFERLVDGLRNLIEDRVRQGSAIEIDFDDMRRVATDTLVGRYLGSAIEVVAACPSWDHPILTPLILEFNTRADGIDVPRLFQFPHLEIDDIIYLVARPMLFDFEATGGLPLAIPQGSPLQKSDIYDPLMLTAVLHQLVRDPRPRYCLDGGSDRGLSWMAAAHQGYVLLGVEHDELVSCDVALFDRLLGLGADASKTPELWGRCFVDFESDGVEPSWELRKAFLRRLRDTIPYFPVFLATNQLLGVSEWFAAVTDCEEERDFSWDQPAAVAAAIGMVDAISEHAAESALDPSIQCAGLLRGLAEPQTQLLLRRPSLRRARLISRAPADSR